MTPIAMDGVCIWSMPCPRTWAPGACLTVMWCGRSSRPNQSPTRPWWAADLPRLSGGRHEGLFNERQLPSSSREVTVTVTTTPTSPPAAAVGETTGRFSWYRSLPPQGRRAFAGAFGGYALDSYDFLTLPMGMVAIGAYFSLDTGPDRPAHHGHAASSRRSAESLAGILADRIGRVGR